MHGRIAGEGGIRLKGKLTLEIDQSVCPEKLAALLGSSHEKGYESSYPNQEDPQEEWMEAPQAQALPPQLLAMLRYQSGMGQRPSNPNVFPVSGGLYNYAQP